MKKISFSYPKRPILTFEAEEVELAREAGAFLVQAQGRTAFQDMPALEELMYTNPECLLSVTQDQEELLQGRYDVTFLVFEPEQLVVRISPLQ